MKIISLLLILSLFITSCSTWVERTPSSEVPTIDEVLSVKLSGETLGHGYEPYLKSVINGLYNPKITLTSGIIDAKKLGDGVGYKIVFEIIDNKYTIKLLYTAEGIKDHVATSQALSYFANLARAENSVLSDPHAFFELYYNAKEKDLQSLSNFLKIKSTTNPAGDLGNFTESMKAELLSRSNEAKQEVKNLAPLIKKNEAIKQAQKEKRKALMATLDKASDSEQFKTLVAKNDRKGVVALLKKYLPYEEMAPFEKRFWDNYLDIIQHPVPHSERIFVFRGLNGDFIHSAIVDGQELDKDVAIKESKAFLMSTVLVKNQGSWNRRLRSLESMNEKEIGEVMDSHEYSQSARISTFFKNHSNDPVGSPFLSFTPSVDVAYSFGSEKTGGFLIDPRLLSFNYASGFDNEKEFLVNLVTFPDDMVTLWSNELHFGKYTAQFFDDKLLEFAEEKFGKTQAPAIVKKIKENSNDFFSPVYKDPYYKGTNYPTNISEFFKKFLVKAEPAPVISPKGEINCTDIIKMFWTQAK